MCTVVPTKPMQSTWKWVQLLILNACKILTFVFPQTKQSCTDLEQQWGWPNFHVSVYYPFNALLPVMHIVPFIHSSESFCVLLRFIMALNVVWCRTKPCLYPWKTNLPRSCRMLTFKAPEPVYKRYFSMNMHVSALILDLKRMGYIIRYLPGTKTRPSPMMECYVPALSLSHTHAQCVTIGRVSA